MQELVIVYSTHEDYISDVSSGADLSDTLCLVEETGGIFLNNKPYGSKISKKDLEEFGLAKFSEKEGIPYFGKEELLRKSDMCWLVGK